jgi:uncharacterized membrane protein
MKTPDFHAYLLLVWVVLGGIFRFARLTVLPPWTDECATAIFSLGHSFLPVPLNEVISTSTLLEPLQYTPKTDVGATIAHLLQESTHPPVYFALMHFWLQLFPTGDGFISVWGLRGLSAIFGVVSIPLFFSFSWYIVRSYQVAHCVAALAALSPFGIFLARQARHYTLIILMIILSLWCLVRAIEAMQNPLKPLPPWFGCFWATFNGLGLATHYFFSLTLALETIVLIRFAFPELQHNRKAFFSASWQQIYLAMLGTLVSALVWLPTVLQLYDTPLTHWVNDGHPRSEWIEPLLRMLLWILSMIFALPSAFFLLPIWALALSGLCTLAIVIILVPGLVYGFKSQVQSPTSGLGMQILGWYLLAAIFLFLCLTYGMEMDLTLADRFQFIYFPMLIIFVGACLAACWEKPDVAPLLFWQKFSFPIPNSLMPNSRTQKISLGQRFVIQVLAFACVGALGVTWNLTYLQNHRPDLLFSLIQKESQAPWLIVTGHQHHGDTGRMMGLGWQFRHFPIDQQPEFLLASWKQYDASIAKLRTIVSQDPRPLTVWFVDILGSVELEVPGCTPDAMNRGEIGGHRYKLYRCY